MKEKKMFVIIVKYIKPLEQVDELVPAHVKFLEDCYERSEFICWGRQNPRVGGIILADVNSLEHVWALIKKDPFFVHQVAEFEVIEFIPSSPTHKPHENLC